ncbi:CoA transferase [Aestuariivita sp.]|uniref:CoA transferase n=1 Tax=Aestuariivita sp. TaxID=1872407 RepID=UPI0021714969|nr:CoA transferase [Aestuariivita sp.]MCE8007493.1 acyl-CoA transferase [Aestuariivita sp.]
MHPFQTAIADALGTAPTDQPKVRLTGAGTLPACFDVTGLATASVSAAAQELAAASGVEDVRVDRRLALKWFDMTLRPQGWQMPGAWDPIAGDYAARDGWIRLHTNAPRHRAAAMSVLGCPPDRDAVARAVQRWDRDALETAVIAAEGCAAAMRGLSDWACHPQGMAVAAEPLIRWDETGHCDRQTGLSGLRVLDLTRVLAGPVATRFLAGFGADVLRIDPPGWSEPGVEPEVTLGKRCAGLDLHTDADRAIFRHLLSQADVLVHGYRPGALDALGFGSDTRLSLNPAVIDVSLNAYGWTGPWRLRRGFDSLMQMSTGISAEGMARGQADRPVPLPVQALDHATGYLMAAAILRALRVRAATGRVLRARLSLARTAYLLTSGGAQDLSPPLAPERPADLAPEREETGWGPAQRVRFPVTLAGHPPRWPHPAGLLRRHSAAWRAPA